VGHTVTMFTKADTTRSSDQPAPPKAVRIGDLLLERGLITQEQIEHALSYQRDRGHKKLLGEILVELKYVTEEQVMEELARAYDVPFARITPKVADPRIIEVLPREFLEKHNVLPLFHVQNKLTIALHEPTNVFLIEEIGRLTDSSVQVVAATIKDIQATLQAHLPNSNVFVIDDLVDDVDEGDLTLVEQQVTDLSNLEAAAGDSPVIKLVNYVIFSAVEEGASDIHIEPDEKNLRVRFRQDGTLFEKMKPPFQMAPAIASRIKIMAGLDISERRIPQDGGITVMLGKQAVDLRVSTMPGKFGEKVVIRIIDKSGMSGGLEQCGFSFEMLQKLRHVIHQPNGIILITGPTGSGKSTTLYGMLNELNEDSVNISTVEDPVENNVPGINQFQTNDKAGFTFAKALRSLLRQDPDIVMVGEIRDQETGKIAVQAALTGHVVLSTLHTNDAPSAVTRLFNIGVEPYLVAASIRGVLAQRLLRRICQRCKEPVEVSSKIRKSMDELAGGDCGIDTFYHGVGCPKCKDRGMSGRVGVFELFVPDDEALDAVSRGVGLQELKRMALASGYTTLAQDGLEKVRAGVTTPEELLRAVAMT